MKKKIQSQSLLKIGDKFSLFAEATEPQYEIVEQTGHREFSVKRLPSGIIDKKQKLPHPSGDAPAWIWIEEKGE